jgi:hypothetical protein
VLVHSVRFVRYHSQLPQLACAVTAEQGISCIGDGFGRHCNQGSGGGVCLGLALVATAITEVRQGRRTR